MVRRLFVLEDKNRNFESLKEIGARAVPQLVAALDDPETRTARFIEGRGYGDPKSPFERICKLLGLAGASEAIVALAGYLVHDDPHFRRQAAWALGAIGSKNCIEGVSRALADEGKSVQLYTTRGIAQGIAAKHCTQEFLAAVFPHIQELIRKGTCDTYGEAEKLLLEIDPDRGASFLLSPDLFTIHNRKVDDAIKALNAIEHKIPHDVLLPFLETLTPLSGGYPFDRVYGEALLAYARNPDAAARETFMRVMRSSNDRPREAAALALAHLSGVPDAVGVAFGELERIGYDALPLPLQYFVGLYTFGGMVDNGGHRYFFENSTAHTWKEMVEGLNVIGAPVRASALEAVALLFGPDGPPAEPAARNLALDEFSEEQEAELKAMDCEYFSAEENISVLLQVYAIANKAHFVRVRE
jgi:HEAT repeat protein